MSGNRCGHFSLEIEEMRLPHTYISLRVPIRRCALAEHMVLILSRSEEGRSVAKKLTTGASQENLAEGADHDPETIRVAFGPDLEAIHAEYLAKVCDEEMLRDVEADEAGEGGHAE